MLYIIQSSSSIHSYTAIWLLLTLRNHTAIASCKAQYIKLHRYTCCHHVAIDVCAFSYVTNAIASYVASHVVHKFKAI